MARKNRNRNKEVRTVNDQQQDSPEVKENQDQASETTAAPTGQDSTVVADAASQDDKVSDQQDDAADITDPDPATKEDTDQENDQTDEDTDEGSDDALGQEDVTAPDEDLTPGEKEIDTRADSIIGSLARLQDDNGKYFTGMEFMRAVDYILIGSPGEKTGALISRLISKLKEHSINEVSIVTCLSSQRFVASQREYIKTIAMMFFNGDTKGGRAQLTKQLSVEKIMTAVGPERAGAIKKWLGVS